MVIAGFVNHQQLPVTHAFGISSSKQTLTLVWLTPTLQECQKEVCDCYMPWQARHGIFQCLCSKFMMIHCIWFFIVGASNKQVHSLKTNMTLENPHVLFWKYIFNWWIFQPVMLCYVSLGRTIPMWLGVCGLELFFVALGGSWKNQSCAATAQGGTNKISRPRQLTPYLDVQQK